MLYIVSAQTPLKKLPEYKELSARAQNLCLREEIYTIGKLLAVPDDKLMRFKNCGVRSVYELQGLKMKYSYLRQDDAIRSSHGYEELVQNESFWNAIDSFLGSYYANASYEAAHLIQRFVGDKADFVEFICADHPDVLARLTQFTWKEFSVMREYLHGFLSSVFDQVSYYDKDMRNAEARVSDIMKRAPLELARHLLEVYPSVVRINMNTEYQKFFQGLSTRAKNVFHGLANIEEALPYLTGVAVLTPFDFQGCGNKTFKDFDSFMEERKQVFNTTLSELAPNRSQEYYLEEYCTKYLHLYPFLSREDQAHLAVMEIMGEKKPDFSIWYKYVTKSDDIRIRIMRNHLGLNPEHRRYSFEELGEHYELSNERVRQICLNVVADDYVILVVKNNVAARFDDIAISNSNPVWKEIIEEQNLAVTPEEVMGLVTLANPDYEFVVLDELNNHCCLLSRRKIKRIRIKNVVGNLERTYRLRHYNDIKVDLLQMAAECIGDAADAADVRNVASVLSDCFINREGVESPQQAVLVFLRNSINKLKEVEEVIRSHGEPMSVAEIFEAYNSVHVSDPIKSLSSLHSYLLRSPDIVALGKRGMYALKEWTGIYKGCIKDYIPEVLEQMERPVSLTELTGMIREVFPDTNERSVSSLINLDEGRYIIYDRNYVGLADKEYKDWTVSRKKVSRRESFEDRFKEFCDFVREYGRLPYTTKDSAESSLDRWRKNIETGKVVSTRDQRQALAAFLESQSDLPQNGKEYSFLRKCEMLRSYVENNGKLPRSIESINLYNWLKKAREQKGTWHDNRENYFDTLTAWLRSRGLW